MTPRSLRAQPRGIGTLIGNGWLREQPRHAFPANLWWGGRGKSAMRKCMFMPVPEEIRNLPHQPSSPLAAPQARPVIASQDVVPHRHDPRRDVRQMPAIAGGLLGAPRVAHALHVPVAAPRRANDKAAWWEDPVALGSLLILFPPIGLAAVWSSKRYSSDARWALTVMTALTMCLISAVVIAGLAMS